MRFTFPHAPVSTLQLRITKGIEQFYYVLLFSDSPEYAGPKIWRDWLEMGFHVAVKTPPPGTAAQDRIAVTVVAPSKSPRVILEGANEHYLQRLEGLLHSIDAARASLVGLDDAAAMKTLYDGPVGEELIRPLSEVLQKEGFRPDEVDTFQEMIQRGLLALVYEDIKEMELINS